MGGTGSIYCYVHYREFFRARDINIFVITASSLLPRTKQSFELNFLVRTDSQQLYFSPQSEDLFRGQFILLSQNSASPIFLRQSLLKKMSKPPAKIHGNSRNQCQHQLFAIINNSKAVLELKAFMQEKIFNTEYKIGLTKLILKHHPLSFHQLSIKKSQLKKVILNTFKSLIKTFIKCHPQKSLNKNVREVPIRMLIYLIAAEDKASSSENLPI